MYIRIYILFCPGHYQFYGHAQECRTGTHAVWKFTSYSGTHLTGRPSGAVKLCEPLSASYCTHFGTHAPQNYNAVGRHLCFMTKYQHPLIINSHTALSTWTACITFNTSSRGCKAADGKIWSPCQVDSRRMARGWWTSDTKINCHLVHREGFFFHRRDARYSIAWRFLACYSAKFIAQRRNRLASVAWSNASICAFSGEVNNKSLPRSMMEKNHSNALCLPHREVAKIVIELLTQVCHLQFK